MLCLDGVWVSGSSVKCNVKGGFVERMWVHSSRRSSQSWPILLYVRAHRAAFQTRDAPGRANDCPKTCPKKHTRCDLNTNFGRAHQARRCCAASCKERFLASSSRRTDTSGGSWSTVCNTFTTGHVVMGVFIRLKARTPSGGAEYPAPLSPR